MATRDPHIISEQFIPVNGGMSVVRETRATKGEASKYELVNKDEIDTGMHRGIIEQAKKSEDKPSKKDGPNN